MDELGSTGSTTVCILSSVTTSNTTGVSLAFSIFFPQIFSHSLALFCAVRRRMDEVCPLSWMPDQSRRRIKSGEDVWVRAECMSQPIARIVPAVQYCRPRKAELKSQRSNTVTHTHSPFHSQAYTCFTTRTSHTKTHAYKYTSSLAQT